MKNEKYVSSIISKYGDTENVRQDLKTIKEIHSRQGTSLLIDAIAEHVGSVVKTYNLSTQDRDTLVDSLVHELRDALNERT